MRFEFVNHWKHTWGKKAWKDFFRNDHFIILGIQWAFPRNPDLVTTNRIEITLLNFGLEITWLPKKTQEYRDMERAERERSPIFYATQTNDKGEIIKVPKLKPLR